MRWSSLCSLASTAALVSEAHSVVDKWRPETPTMLPSLASLSARAPRSRQAEQVLPVPPIPARELSSAVTEGKAVPHGGKLVSLMVPTRPSAPP